MSLIKVQDIQCNDYTLYKQFVDYWKSGQYGNALALLSNSQFNNKAMVASLLNSAFTNVKNLENYYYTGVEDKLADNLTAFNTAVDNLKYDSAYSSTKTYTKGNCVVYLNRVYLYKYSTPSSGHLPSISTYWVSLNLRGEKGADGLGLNLKYSWSTNINYATKDIVYYNGVMYYAKQNNKAQVPSNASAYWGVLFTISNGGIEFGGTTPAKPYNGMIWFEDLAYS